MRSPNCSAVAVADAQLLREPGCHQVQVPEQFAVLLADVAVGRDDLARDDEDVDGGMRVDVVDGHALLVLVGDAGGDFLLDDLQEEVLGHHGPGRPFGRSGGRATSVQ